MGSWRRAAVAAMLVRFSAACGNGSSDSDEPDLGASDGAAFDLDLSLELARLCLQSYQALDDFQNGQPFALPAPYALVKEFFTDEPYEGQSIDGQVPIAFVATRGTTVYVVFRGTKTITE